MPPFLAPVIQQISGKNIITDGLVGWWDIEEGSGGTTADSSPNEYTLTLANGPTWVANDASGFALNFDGGIQYCYGQMPQPLPPMTICVRVFLNSAAATSAGLWSSNDWNSTGEYQGIHLALASTGTFFVQLGSGGGIGADNRYAQVSATQLPVGQWITLSGVVNTPNNIQIYLNEIVDNGATSGVATALQYNGTDGYLARRDDGGHANAKIDWCRVYDRALTAQEIADIAAGLG